MMIIWYIIGILAWIGLIVVTIDLFKRIKIVRNDVLPPPRKYKKPPRPKNDDPNRWWG